MNSITPRLSRTLTAARPYLPGIRELILPLCLLALMLLSNHAAAAGNPTIDQAVGSNLTSQSASFIKSVQNSLVIKLLCAGIFLWGLLTYLPTRKNGVGQMIAGIAGFLILSRLTEILSIFGMTFN